MSSTGFVKRQKELRRQEKQREKAAKRVQRKLDKDERAKSPDGLDGPEGLGDEPSVTGTEPSGPVIESPAALAL